MTIFQPDRYLLHKFIKKHAPQFSGEVLDVGCGSKRYKNLFSHCKYKSLDPDQRQNPDITAYAEEIPLPDQSVDGILCTQVLGDIWNVKKAVGEMARILVTGGKILITESLHDGLHDEPHDYWRFSPHTFVKLLSDTFEIETIEPRGGYFSVRAQMHIRRAITSHHLYERPLIGKLASVPASILGHIAIWRDSMENDEMRGKFAIGYNILARKK